MRTAALQSSILFNLSQKILKILRIISYLLWFCNHPCLISFKGQVFLQIPGETLHPSGPSSQGYKVVSNFLTCLDMLLCIAGATKHSTFRKHVEFFLKIKFWHLFLLFPLYFHCSYYSILKCGNNFHFQNLPPPAWKWKHSFKDHVSV